MSEVELPHAAGLVPVEVILPNPNRVRARLAESQSFGDLLREVQRPPEETIAGGPADAAGSHTAGQPAAEARPADDQTDDRRSAATDSDQGTREQASSEGPTESDQAGASESKTETDGHETAETDEASRQGDEGPSEMDAESGADEAESVDPGTVVAGPLPEELGDQVVEANGDGQASEHTSADGEGKGEVASTEAASRGQAEAGGLATQASAKEVTAENGPSIQPVAEDDPAAGSDDAETDAKASHRARGQETVVGQAGNRSGEAGDEGDEVPGRQKEAPAQAPLAGTPLHAGLPEGESEVAEDQTDRQAQQPKTPAGAAAAASQARTQAIAGGKATSEDELANLAQDGKSHAAEEAVRSVVPTAPDGRLNASLRTSPGQEPRAGTTQQAQVSEESIQVDRARFVRRVARAFGAVGRRGGSVRLRLSPPELGSLRIEISVRNGQLAARLEAETATARNLLLDNLPALRDRLAQQNIKVQQFDVDLMDQSPDGLPDQTADQTHSHDRGGSDHTPRPSGDVDRDTNGGVDPSVANRPGEGTQLNVII